MIDFKSNIEIEEVFTWMDGGSITLKCKNENNQEFEIEFVQTLSWDVYESNKIPGRIYLNNILIDQKSILEEQIINGLKNATLKHKNRLDKKTLSEKLEYVNSEKYLTDQSRIIKVKRT